MGSEEERKKALKDSKMDLHLVIEYNEGD